MSDRHTSASANSSIGMSLDQNITLSSDHASPRDESPAQTQHQHQRLDPPRVCRFFNTGKGCRLGDQCPFKHVQRVGTLPHREAERLVQNSDGSAKPAQPEVQRHPVRSVGTGSRPSPSQRPISQLQQTNPHEFQLDQVIRRFSPNREEKKDNTVLSFAIRPSDPDFPFELEGGLRCRLTIPSSWPQNGSPVLRVDNAEMPRGFQINVEKGFDSLVIASPQKTLLALLNDLDRNLESFLISEKAQTIKITANSDRTKKHATASVEPAIAPSPVAVAVNQPVTWTTNQKAAATTKRQADVRQLEARMGRVPGFQKSADGTTFTVPLQIPQPGRLPSTLQSLKEAALVVPKLYNLEPCTVFLKGVGGVEAQNVEIAFEKHCREHSDMTLMAHVNHLTQNIHTMVSAPEQHADATVASAQNPPSIEEALPDTSAEDAAESLPGVADRERPHLRIVPRPPEWDRHDSDKASDESSYDSDDYTESDDSEDLDDEINGGGTALPQSSALTTDSGIHLSFPGLELHGIELLTLASLSLSVKCLRCKSQMDIANIKASGDATPPLISTRTESCSKCTTPFTFAFTANALHMNSIRAGTIEVNGCTISDLLPSVFQPTCSSCSTTFPSPPGMISVRGDTPIQVCRSCHAKMTFTIHEVKFLRVSHAHAELPLRRPKKENLGISAGTPLPDDGTCPHYRHSYRWFRFGCCNRVYACDRCHDTAEKHVNERADRMVCGWCSREQRFRSEDCGVCGRSVIRRKKVGGFWEGGQGTRERKLMSRKEKRKYKRPSGKEAQSAKKSEK